MSKTLEQTNKLPRVLSIAGLAQELGLSRRTVCRALASGELEHFRVGARALIPESAAVAWLESCRVSKRPRLRVVA